MTITIVGAGYVGLTAGAIFADQGNTVWLVRRDHQKIEQVKQGIIPFFEPGLEQIVRENVANGRLRPTDNFSDSVPESDIIFICVGTPPMSDGSADLRQVYASAASIAPHLAGYTVVVNKSTVPIGTAERVREILARGASSQAEYSVASCPEFLRESTAVADSRAPDRIVIGTEDDRARALLIELHATLPGKRVFCDVKTAEMIKYASNALLATEISFINSIAQLCERVGANVNDVALGMKLDHRIGPHAFLSAGCGYGGSCFPKDVKALIHIARGMGSPLPLLEAVESVNEAQKLVVYRKLQESLGNIEGKTVGIWGLSFKPNTDDIREAPALRLIETLLVNGAAVKAYDPVANANTARLYPGVQYCQSALDAIDKSDVLCVMTEWDEFQNRELMGEVKQRMRSAVVIDGRNMFDPRQMKELGFEYYSVGRPL